MPWTPASLSNLLAWYSADSGVYKDAGSTLAANTDTVQQWNDLSGNGYHLKQATGGNRPQYLSAGFNSLPTVKFTAATPTGMLTNTDSVAVGNGTAASAFAVGQMLTGSQTQARLTSFCAPFSHDYVSGGCVFLKRNSTNNEFASERSGTVGAQAISLATNYRFGVVYDGVNGTTYLNNANATATANTNAFNQAGDGPGSIGVGMWNDNQALASGLSWDGPISEVVITLSALSSTDRSDLDTYFVNRWISPPTSTQGPRSIHQFRQRAA